MDIESLRLRITEEELNSLLADQVPKDSGVKDLRISLIPEGVQVNGRYTGMLLPISFEMLWELAVADGLLQAKLNSVKVAGFPATKMRGILLGVMFDHVGEQPGIQRQDEVIRINLNEVLQARQVPVRLTPKAVRCDKGSLVFEAGQ